MTPLLRSLFGILGDRSTGHQSKNSARETETMSDVTIYHNPRCSKSRQTLALLKENGKEPTVVEYLKTPPDAASLAEILDQLGIEPFDLLRRKEAPFQKLDLASKKDDRDALIRAMVENPVLIERPIVVSGGRAKIGRPPEDVLEIL